MTDLGSSSKPAQLLLQGSDPNKPSEAATGQSRRSLAPGTSSRPSTQARPLPPTSRAAPNADENPPPICPSLILPNTEARFMVAVARLQHVGPQNFSLYGGSGRELLHCSVDEPQGGGHRLSISSVGCEFPRAVVMSGRSGNYDIYGRDNQFYGTLEFAGERGLLMVGGYPVMALDTSEGLKKMASRMDGRILASAQPVSAQLPDGGTAWMVQVRPGMDAILVTSCMLTSMLLPAPTGYATPSLPAASPHGSMSMAGTAQSLHPPSSRSVRSQPRYSSTR